MKPILIAIVGGSGAGKTTFAKHLQSMLGVDKCTMISEDNYYRSDAAANHDYDELRDFDNKILANHLHQLQKGHTVHGPKYDFNLHRRSKQHVTITPKSFIIVEGLYLLVDKTLRKLFDYRIYINVEPDVRLARRILRDNVFEKRASDEQTLDYQIRYYLDFVKPKYDRLILPAQRHADLVVGNNKKLEEAIEIFSKKINKSWLVKSALKKLNQPMA